MRPLQIALLLSTLAVACSSSSSNTPAGASDSGAAGDTGGGGDAAPMNDAGGGGGDSGGTTGPAANGCKVTDYMDMSTGSDSGRMIMVSGGKFDMPCMVIAKGQSVMFMWDFTMYPMAPGLSPDHSTDPPGTTPTPIPSATTGMMATVAFPTAGTYPYYVTGHTGMSGVVLVQ